MKEKWIVWEDKNVGFVIPRNNITNKDENVYITDRKKPFEFRNRLGFSISKGILLKRLQPIGVKSIRVKLMENGICKAVYITTLEKWLREGEENFYGYSDTQLFLPFEKFDKVGDDKKFKTLKDI